MSPGKGLKRSRRPSLVARCREAGGIVIGCVQTKGGAGDSTLAYNLAHEYAQLGASVLLIDGDIQQTLVDAANARTVAPILTVMPYPHESLWQDLPRLRGGYDVTVIDGPGHHVAMTMAVITAVALDKHGVLLVPVGASIADVRPTRRDMAPLLARAEGLVPWKLRARTVLMRFDTGETVTTTVREALAEPPVVAAPLAAEGLARRTIYPRSLETGLAVCELDSRSAAKAEVAAVAREVAELALSDVVLK
ncbi:ParA family protein [Nocardia tengchongensis]|uniref:ParA family protein n=1 Tax=Nocardia tengchongensis TaxID=2055889 RepID=UPI0036781D76